MNSAITRKIPVRNFICALAACVLTVVLLGGISQGSEQAAQRAVLQQA
jgi:hypothetical protein